ncbi:MAG: ATP-binding cassette domain-containing protein [Desulfobacteraceae bacterium]|nr:MAG: ATP-binding cassette domain-containing protein [Desulfobacteraceae bacterium]
MREITPVVDAVDLRKTYDRFTAVDGVIFHIDPGECYGFLGPNGAGKTTIIRMIYGFSPITGGSLRVFGLDLREHWREIRGRIGVCQQHNALDPDLSVEENLLVFAGYFLMDSREARARTEELLDFFALAGKRNAKVMELSGGLARRLTVARALINKPDLVILDEPTTGLDPQSRHQLWEKLQELRRSGITLLLTTHYMEEASRLCNRLMIIDHGRILVEGSPDELVEQYAGDSVVEVEGADENLKNFLAEEKVLHDVTDRRIVIYANNSVSEQIRTRFCKSRCTYRTAGLEDVFLHLTGRELRE